MANLYGSARREAEFNVQEITFPYGSTDGAQELNCDNQFYAANHFLVEKEWHFNEFIVILILKISIYLSCLDCAATK